MFFLLVSTVVNRETIKNIVGIKSNGGNSGTAGEGVDVSEGGAEVVGECCGIAVGAVEGLEDGDEPEVDDVGLGVGVGFCVGAGDGLLLLAEL